MSDTIKISTPEKKQKRIAINKRYYEKNREAINGKTKEKRLNATEDEKALKREYLKKWNSENKERISAQKREYYLRRKEKQLSESNKESDD